MAIDQQSDCLFCGIVAGRIPAQIVGESPHVIASVDIAPQAPQHYVVTPRSHFADVPDLAAKAPQVLADMVALASQLATDRSDGQFRLVFNTGSQAGQSVFHVHGHVFTGGKLGDHFA